MKHILLIPHLKIHNANALSSPFTLGFPAMTAWLGAMHALQRNLNRTDSYDKEFKNIHFNSLAVTCHDLELQVYKEKTDSHYSLIGNRNPMYKTKKTPAFIESGRCHLEASLIIELNKIALEIRDKLIDAVSQLLHSSMKIAGGDVIRFKTPELITVDPDEQKDIDNLNRKVMPGYTLVERRDIMMEAMQNGQDPMDALIDRLVVTHNKKYIEHEKYIWEKHKETRGWLVPIATGFQGLTPLGKAKNQRDSDTPHRFAESIVTLGEFIMPYRIKNLDQMLWYMEYDSLNNLYLCRQK